MLRIYRLGSLVVLMSLVSIVSRAQEADDEAKSAEKVLAAKGLKKFGASLVALEETELNKTFRVIPKLKRSVRDAEKALAAVGKKAAANKKLITVYTQKRRQINAALAKGGLTFNQQNQAITLYNELGDRIRLLIENGGMEKQLKAARGERNKAREAYIGHVLNMRKLAEKIRKTYADATADEEAKVAVRNIRRHAMDSIKKAQKDGEIPEDDAHRLSDVVQKATDKHAKDVDEAFKRKEKDIMEI